MPELRQKLLVLYLHSPDLHSKVVAWPIGMATNRA